MSDYQAPQIISSHAVDELAARAASCAIYSSDSTLKTDVTRIDRPLGGLRTPAS